MESAALSSATKHVMPQKIGGTECRNTRLPLPTLLYAGYSVKLKKKCNMYLLLFLIYINLCYK